MSAAPLRLGFLASHNGSSLRAIVEAARRDQLAAKAVVVISNNAGAAALAFARAEAIPAAHISATTEGGADAADRAIAGALERAGAELVVLSGYMRKLGPETLRRFQGRILNIHPALLPHHGGQGMYGRRVHEAVLGRGDAVSGATIHLVDEEYDHGAIVRQRRIKVRPGESVESLQSRVMAVEPGLYIQTLREIMRRDRCVLPRRRKQR